MPFPWNAIEIPHSLGLLDESEGRLTESLEKLRREFESYTIHYTIQGFSTPNPTADYARVLRKAGRIAEAAQVEASMQAASHAAAAGTQAPGEAAKR